MTEQYTYDSLIEQAKAASLLKEKLTKQVVAILKQHGIKMTVGGCGCCYSPWVEFEYNGEVIVNYEDGQQFNIDEDDYK